VDIEYLVIFLHDKPIGKLWLEDKQFCFQYTCVDTPPLSVSLPVREQPYLKDASRAFFANLLPEGLAREAIAHQLRISWADDFGLLRELGEDCAGAVRIFPENGSSRRVESYEDLTPDQLANFVLNLKAEPLGTKKMRLSLAGAQTKVPVRIHNQQYSLPLGGAPSTHIIKVSSSHFPDTVENETFIMRLAKNVGLNVPHVSQLPLGKITAFVIERYDRIVTEDSISRLLQEDFCQVLGFEPEFKYQGAGGPSLVDCFKIIDDCSFDTLSDRDQLLKWVAFNVAVGNADAHAKNLSLLYTPDGIRLAPFYDLLSTSVYGSSHDADFAMTIGRSWDSLKITDEDWGLLANDINFRQKAVTRTAFGVYERVRATLGRTLEEYEHEYPKNQTVSDIVHNIQNRLEILLNPQ